MAPIEVFEPLLAPHFLGLCKFWRPNATIAVTWPLSPSNAPTACDGSDVIDDVVLGARCEERLRGWSSLWARQWHYAECPVTSRSRLSLLVERIMSTRCVCCCPPTDRCFRSPPPLPPHLLRPPRPCCCSWCGCCCDAFITGRRRHCRGVFAMMSHGAR